MGPRATGVGLGSYLQVSAAWLAAARSLSSGTGVGRQGRPLIVFCLL
jgi:hypothetical protein